MIGKDLAKVINYNFVALHTPLITSLKGPGEKMSKSLPGSGIAVTDSKEEIEKAIKGAYCPEMVIEENPVLQIMNYIVFPRFEQIEIKRDKKFGGDVKFKNYNELEEVYASGKLHPLDLKKACAEYLEEIIAPIRKNYK
jgi:tyrosyl-tRNA synthetase